MVYSAEQRNRMAADATEPTSDRHARELRVVSELERLPGVVSAAVWLDPDGTLHDVRLTASPATPGLIVANAASAVLRRHGLERAPDEIRVDHARTASPESVTAPAGGQTPALPSRYLLLHEITVSRSAGRASVVVQIGCRGEIFPGEATELDTEAGRIRAAVRATIAAAERVTERVSLGVDATTALDLFGRRFVAVAIEAAAGRRFVTLNGFVTCDEQRAVEEAAALATLRAIERWIAW
jgi:hypothetical protein